MNRRQRRAARANPSTRRILKLQHEVERTGQIGVVYGLTGGCSDCDADAEILVLPGHRVTGVIYHASSCPALTGVVQWAPVPVDDDDLGP